MNILLTGNTGLAAAIIQHLSNDQYTISSCSKSSGHDIQNIDSWGHKYINYDTVINCACEEWGQLQVLEFFYAHWRLDNTKIIINVGSIVTDYTRTEKELDFEYSKYRLQKQALQLAFQKMSRRALCDIKLINPGPIDTAMVNHLKCNKLSTDSVAKHVCRMLTQSDIKRLDLWA